MRSRILALAIFLFASLPNLANAENIIIANYEWAPYAGESLPHHGLLSDITKSAFKNQGIDIQYEFMTFEQGLAQTKAGTVSGTTAWTNLTNWSDDYLYSNPIMKHDLVIYKRVYAELKTKPLTKLYGKRIGIQKGQRYNKLLMTLIDNDRLTPIYSDSPKESFYKLLTGKVDFCVQTSLAGQATLNKYFTESEIGALNNIESTFSISPSYLALSAKPEENKILMEKFNAGLKAIKQDGTFDKMVENFLADLY